MNEKRSRVFVVEDHPATARGLKVFLELAGYTVTVAGDMRSALQIASNHEFDVLVCDLNLPDGTGWELMEKLRKKGNVRGIVFSAFDEPEHFARSKAAGFDEHVVKGTTPEALLDAIDRVAKFRIPDVPLVSRDSAGGVFDGSVDGDGAPVAKPPKRSSTRARKSQPTK
jgi:CheY-like chemotaxis protein